MEVIGFSQVITMMGSFLVVILLLAVTLFGIKKYSAVMGISGEQRHFGGAETRVTRSQKSWWSSKTSISWRQWRAAIDWGIPAQFDTFGDLGSRYLRK